MKSGLTKGETTCKHVRKCETCPYAGKGCPFNHKKPKNAAPAQPSTGKKTSAAPAQDKGTRGRSKDRSRKGQGRSQAPTGGRGKGAQQKNR
eukprot:7374644-Pyramimonas_sp.AAC.1